MLDDNTPRVQFKQLRKYPKYYSAQCGNKRKGIPIYLGECMCCSSRYDCALGISPIRSTLSQTNMPGLHEKRQKLRK